MGEGCGRVTGIWEREYMAMVICKKQGRGTRKDGGDMCLGL